MIQKKIKFLKKREDNHSQLIILVANSSWYLKQYSSLLIKQISDLNMIPIALAPRDKFTKDLSKLSSYIEWKVSTKNNYNFFSILKAFLSLFNLIYELKPAIIQSHTIRPNL